MVLQIVQFSLKDVTGMKLQKKMSQDLNLTCSNLETVKKKEKQRSYTLLDCYSENEKKRFRPLTNRGTVPI